MRSRRGRTWLSRRDGAWVAGLKSGSGVARRARDAKFAVSLFRERRMPRMKAGHWLDALVCVVALSHAVPARAQGPLAPLKASGQTVTPAFEGWYRNPDGTFSISFGYYNRNTEESLEIPIGPDNFVEPG